MGRIAWPIGIFVCLLVASACSSTPELTPTPTPTGNPWPEIVTAAPAGEVRMPVTAGERLTDSSLIVVNVGMRSARLVSVEPLLDLNAGTLEVIAIQIVERTEDGPGAVERTYPPRLLGGVLRPIAGFSILPAAEHDVTYAIAVGLKMGSGVAKLIGLRLVYEAGGRTFEKTFPRVLELYTEPG